MTECNNNHQQSIHLYLLFCCRPDLVECGNVQQTDHMMMMMMLLLLGRQ